MQIGDEVPQRPAPEQTAGAQPEQPAARERYVVRFDRHQRLQHFLMMSSFIVLALTGLPQKFSGLAISQWWVNMLGGLEMVRTLHRAAGFVMLSDCVYHIAYLFFGIGVHRRFGALRMIPTRKDLGDVAQTAAYFLGISGEKPKFDRFSYLEKFDYWAVFWGIAVMGGSGLVLMFPVKVTNVLPGQTIAVALAMHSDKALLAVGWIFIVHMFNAHLAPWIFPFDATIFTGKVAAERYAEEHPLEWAQIVSARATAVPPLRQTGSQGTPAARSEGHHEEGIERLTGDVARGG